VSDIFRSTRILNTLGLWPCFTPSLTTDKIVILYVTFWNWSVRQYSCQYMTKFVNLFQYVTVSLPVAVCCLSQLYIWCCDCCCKVLKQIDACGHTVQVKCCEKPDPTMCHSLCNRLLHCGHKCTAVCSALCTAKCQELIPCAVRPACGHLFDVPCYMQNQSQCYRFICVGCWHVMSRVKRSEGVPISGPIVTGKGRPFPAGGKTTRDNKAGHTVCGKKFVESGRSGGVHRCIYENTTRARFHT
jgi:hypothetical protein